MNRRDFLNITGGTLISTSSVLAQANRLQSHNLRIRKSALQLPADDPVFFQYAKAVRLMHELPREDPRHWWNQAKIHADYCAHRIDTFFPWHRWYLYYFEQICGELIGDPNFAIPYWDWTYNTGIIPNALFDIKELNVVFLNDPGVYSSPNWGDIHTYPLRAIEKGVGVQTLGQRGGAFTPERIQQILRTSRYEIFRQQVEGTPHNTGHVVVGSSESGNTGHMGSGLSPLDPLFWMHHCNVDRLWAQWQLAGNFTPDFNTVYDGNFVDAKKNKVQVTADDSMDFVRLGYTYDSLGNPTTLAKLANIIPESTPESESPIKVRSAQPFDSEPEVLGEVKMESPVGVAIENKVKIEMQGVREGLLKSRTSLNTELPPLDVFKSNKLSGRMLEDFGKPQEVSKRIFAKIRNVKSDKFTVDPVVSIFINCPYLSPSIDHTDPHYAGTFALFGASAKKSTHDHDHHHAELDVYMDLTNPIQLLGVDELDQVELQFMALAGNSDKSTEGAITYDSIQILSM